MVNDYAHLNREENLPVKKDLAKLITLLDLKGIHYWVDFATLEKMHNNRKSLYYLNAFDICIMKESYNDVLKAVYDNGFWVSNIKDDVIRLAPEGIEFRDEADGTRAVDKVFSKTTPTFDRILKWIYIWSYDYTDERKEFISLGLPNRDFTYNKEILHTTEKKDVCGIEVNVPVYYDLIKKIRFKDHPGDIWAHGPKKRFMKETQWGFCNFRRDEL